MSKHDDDEASRKRLAVATASIRAIIEIHVTAQRESIENDPDLSPDVKARLLSMLAKFAEESDSAMGLAHDAYRKPSDGGQSPQ
jgi:hypothetical protein